VLLLAAEILQSIGLGESSCITINDVGIFEGLVNELKLDRNLRETLRRLIDTRDRAELQNFLDQNAIEESTRQSLSGLSKLTGKRNVLDKSRELITKPASLAAVDRLERLWQVIESLGMTELFEVDLADVSSLDYYTGLSFKVFVEGVGYRVGRGGRYDGLTANFGKAEPAVGFVLSLDSLVEVLGRNTYANSGTSEEVQSLNTADLNERFAEALRQRSEKRQIRIEAAK
jgi:ATP phosphoribosyltransferase regulatory subunit